MPHAGSARSCVRAPTPPRRAHAPRAPAFALSPGAGSARARSSFHSPPPPRPTLLSPNPAVCLVPATTAPPSRPPAFHPGPRSTWAACRQVPAGPGGSGGDPAPCRDPGRRAPARHRRQRARSPGAALPPRASAPGSRCCRRRARAAQVKEEKKGEKNRKRRPLQQRSAAGLDQAERRTLEPATQGRGGSRPGRTGF